MERSWMMMAGNLPRILGRTRASRGQGSGLGAVGTLIVGPSGAPAIWSCGPELSCYRHCGVELDRSDHTGQHEEQHSVWFCL